MHSTCGIILKRENFRERDERVTLYTKDFGKLVVVAKGIKRIEAKLRGNVDLFHCVDIFFVEGKHFPILTAVDLFEKFPWLSKDAFLYRTALLVAESTLRIFDERARDEEFFTALYGVMKRLNAEFVLDLTKPEISVRSWFLWKKFQMTVLENQGYGGKSLGSAITELSANATRLSSADFLDVEETFQKTFAYFFNFCPVSWIPEIS